MPSFKEAEWAHIDITYRGRGFQNSLTPTAMQGIIELQSTLYRSAAAILRDGPDVRKLSNFDKELLELSFTLTDGSAKTKSDTRGFLQTLAETVTKMESKHILIALLVLGPSYMLSDGVKLWIQERGKEAEKTSLAALSEKIIDQNDRNLRILSDAFKQSAEASTVHHQAVSGVDSVVRNSGAASSVTIQGTRLNREQIEDARRTERRDAKTFQITAVGWIPN